MAGATRADVLLEETFDARPDGNLPDAGEVRQWRGPEGIPPFGSIEVVDEKAAGDKGKSVRFIHTSAEKNKAPILTVLWGDKLPSSGAVKVAVEWKVMMPVEGPFLGLCFLGSNWSNSPVLVILESGKMLLEYGNGKREQLGPYVAGKWYSFQAVVNRDDKTFDFFFDGQKVVSGFPWRKVEHADIGLLSIAADMSERDSAGKPVLYVDDIKVSTLP